jgi:glycosyltransferase involved in cell wall biosynthesis
MNLLILSHKPPYPIIDGGCHAMDRFVRDLIKTFPASKIQYLCIATQKHPFKADEIPKDFGANISFSSVEISTRINPWAAFLHVLQNKSYHISRFKQSAILNKIKAITKKERLDFIFFESIFCGAYIDEINELSNARKILRAHNVEHLIWKKLASNSKNPLKRWYLNHLSKTLQTFELDFISKNDHVFSIAPSDNDYFKKQGIEQANYIPVSMQGRDSKELKAHSICFLGAYNWMPNKEGLLWFANEIFPILQEKHPTLLLHAAGSFSEEINVLKNKKQIVLHGFVPSSKSFISTHGIFIAPILSGSGIKMKVLEAMSLGAPCVVSQHAAEGLDLPELIPVCKNNQDFITQVSLLLQNRELAHEVGAAGLKYIKDNYASGLVSKKIKDTLTKA